MQRASVGKWISRSVFLLLPVIATYYAVGFHLSSGSSEEVVSLLESQAHKTPVVEERSKVASPLSPVEYVMIDAQRFEVLEPWRGHLIGGDITPENLKFAMLPTELTFENREIYVTVETRDAFVEMAKAAALDGVTLLVDSGYRSIAYQRAIYRKKMQSGDDFYDVARWVAPPGYSEHMLGITLDLVPSKWTFSNTPADIWLQKNGAIFSFSPSYPEKSELGFAWEPWHWKYTADN